ncbi:hypothetical protein NHQ30_002045 [Ciborinia camelliae]|nr:hypothetical protein NHQ30_002045 [Ciborinia camelliae]
MTITRSMANNRTGRLSKRVIPKRTASKLAASKLAASKRTASKLAASKLAASKRTASKRTASKLAASKRAASKRTASKLAASKLAASKRTASKLAASKRYVPKRVVTKRDVSKLKKTLPENVNTSNSKPKNGFLDLPFETRLMIYENLLIKTVPITSPSCISQKPLRSRAFWKRVGSACTMLSLNKAIRHEAAEVFYSRSNFVIGCPMDSTMRSKFVPNPHGLRSFLARTPRFYVKCIREITILAPVSLFIDLVPGGYDLDTSFSHSNLKGLENMIAAALQDFPRLRVANIIFTEFDSRGFLAFKNHYMRDVQGKISNYFHILFQHNSLQRISIGVDLMGRPTPFPEDLDFKPSRGIFLPIEIAVRSAIKMQNGIWQTRKTSWNEIFTHEDESRFIRPGLWHIVRTSCLGNKSLWGI